MLLRLMFVLLIALNIAVAAWLLLGESGTHAVDPSDNGVPKLKLLAELPASAFSAPAVSGSAATSALASAAAASTASQAQAPASASASASTERSHAVATPPVVPVAAPAKPVPREPAKKESAETPPAPALLATASTPAPTSAKRSYRCLAIGPFSNQVDL